MKYVTIFLISILLFAGCKAGECGTVDNNLTSGESFKAVRDIDLSNGATVTNEAFPIHPNNPN